MNTSERLAHMANQIATNLATQANPPAAIAEHITLLWDKRMQDMLSARASDGLSEAVVAAIKLIEQARH